jgi:hypothetical protein
VGERRKEQREREGGDCARKNSGSGWRAWVAGESVGGNRKMEVGRKKEK